MSDTKSENRYAVRRDDSGDWVRCHEIHNESAAETIARVAMHAASLDPNDVKTRCQIAYQVSIVLNQMLNSASMLFDLLHDAIDRGGYDVSPCGSCGDPVVCIPDGLPLCESCALKESSNE